MIFYNFLFSAEKLFTLFIFTYLNWSLLSILVIRNKHCSVTRSLPQKEVFLTHFKYHFSVFMEKHPCFGEIFGRTIENFLELTLNAIY